MGSESFRLVEILRFAKATCYSDDIVSISLYAGCREYGAVVWLIVSLFAPGAVGGDVLTPFSRQGGDYQ